MMNRSNDRDVQVRIVAYCDQEKQPHVLPEMTLPGSIDALQHILEEKLGRRAALLSFWSYTRKSYEVLCRIDQLLQPDAMVPAKGEPNTANTPAEVSRGSGAAALLAATKGTADDRPLLQSSREDTGPRVYRAQLWFETILVKLEPLDADKDEEEYKELRDHVSRWLGSERVQFVVEEAVRVRSPYFTRLFENTRQKQLAAEKDAVQLLYYSNNSWNIRDVLQYGFLLRSTVPSSMAEAVAAAEAETTATSSLPSPATNAARGSFIFTSTMVGEHFKKSNPLTPQRVLLCEVATGRRQISETPLTSQSSAVAVPQKLLTANLARDSQYDSVVYQRLRLNKTEHPPREEPAVLQVSVQHSYQALPRYVVTVLPAIATATATSNTTTTTTTATPPTPDKQQRSGSWWQTLASGSPFRRRSTSRLRAHTTPLRGSTSLLAPATDIPRGNSMHRRNSTATPGDHTTRTKETLEAPSLEASMSGERRRQKSSVFNSSGAAFVSKGPNENLLSLSSNPSFPSRFLDPEARSAPFHSEATAAENHSRRQPRNPSPQRGSLYLSRPSSVAPGFGNLAHPVAGQLYNGLSKEREEPMPHAGRASISRDTSPAQLKSTPRVPQSPQPPALLPLQSPAQAPPAPLHPSPAHLPPAPLVPAKPIPVKNTSYACPVHRAQMMVLYCTVCSELTCPFCASIGNHRNHYTVEATEKAAEVCLRAQSLAAELRRWHQEYKRMEQEATAALTAFNHRRQRQLLAMQEEFSAIHRALKQKEDSLRTMVQQRTCIAPVAEAAAVTKKYQQALGPLESLLQRHQSVQNALGDPTAALSESVAFLMTMPHLLDSIENTFRSREREEEAAMEDRTAAFQRRLLQAEAAETSVDWAALRFAIDALGSTVYQPPPSSPSRQSPDGARERPGSPAPLRGATSGHSRLCSPVRSNRSSPLSARRGVSRQLLPPSSSAPSRDAEQPLHDIFLLRCLNDLQRGHIWSIEQPSRFFAPDQKRSVCSTPFRLLGALWEIRIASLPLHQQLQYHHHHSNSAGNGVPPSFQWSGNPSLAPDGAGMMSSRPQFFPLTSSALNSVSRAMGPEQGTLLQGGRAWDIAHLGNGEPESEWLGLFLYPLQHQLRLNFRLIAFSEVAWTEWCVEGWTESYAGKGWGLYPFLRRKDLMRTDKLARDNTVKICIAPISDLY